MAQYEGDESSSIVEEAVTVLEKTGLTKEYGTEMYKKDGSNAGETIGTEESEQSPILALKTVSEDVKLRRFSEEKRTGRDNSSDSSPVNVLLLQGPCSFVRGVWTR